jgi:hypothetical protein
MEAVKVPVEFVFDEKKIDKFFNKPKEFEVEVSDIEVEATLELDKSALDDISTAEIEMEADIDTKSAKESLSGLQSFLENTFGSEFQATFGKLSGLASTFTNSLSGIKGATLQGASAFKVLKLAIVSTGIGALVVAVGTLITYLTQTQAGADILKQIFAGLGAAVSVIIDRLSSFGEGLLQLFSGDFSKGIDTLKNSFKGLGSEIISETKAAYQLAGAMNALEDAEIGLITVQAKRRAEISELRLLAEDETLSINERIKALEKASELEDKIAGDERNTLARKSEILQQQLALGNSTRDEIRQGEELKAQVIDIDSRRALAQKGLQRRLKSLRAERDRENKSLNDNSAEIEKNINALSALEKQGKQNTDEYKNLFKATSDLVEVDKKAVAQVERLKKELGLSGDFAKEFQIAIQKLSDNLTDIQFDIDTEKIKQSSAEVSKFSKETIDLSNILEKSFNDGTKYINDFYDDYSNRIQEQTKLQSQQEGVDSQIRIRELEKKQQKELTTIQNGIKSELDKYTEGSKQYLKIESEGTKLVLATKEKQLLERQNLENENSKKLIELKENEATLLKEVEENKEKAISKISETYKQLTIDSINAIGGEYSNLFSGISEKIFLLGELINSGKANWEDYGAIVGAVLNDISQNLEKGTALQKAFAVTAAIVNTAVAITKALDLPFPLNFIQASLIGAAGLVQLNTIRGAEKGVVGIDGNYKGQIGKTDTIPLMVAKGESVISRKGTIGNEKFFEYANKGGRIGDLINNQDIVKQQIETNYRLQKLERVLSYNKFQNVNLIVENRNNSNVKIGAVRV